jgi:hypothetical protein
MSKHNKKIGLVLAAALMAPSLVLARGGAAAAAVDSWAYVGRDGTSSRSNGERDLEAVRSLVSSGKVAALKGEFLWFRKGGDRYVITDAAVLAPLAPLAAEQSKLGKQQGELGAQQGKLGGEQGELGMQQMELSGKEMKVSHQIEKRSKKDQATTDLDAQMKDLERQRDALIRKQEALAQKQEPLARQQEKLGAQQEKLAHDFEAKLQAAIEQALAKGLAQKL